MRCSACEPLLDRYIECTLPPRQMAAVRNHLAQCSPCSDLLHELRVVDGLLFTTVVPELPQNFTFAVMAEVNSMPAHRVRQHPVWSFLALYSAAAWVAATIAIVLTGTSPRVALLFVWNGIAHAGTAAGNVAGSASHGLMHTTPALAAFGAGVLFLDITVAAAIAVVYLVVRPRLAARLASVPEARS